ncbi:hypothetical protein Sjap_017455 [Stephania japonica]|uniref:Uncharacterized protein n=1 Tax=Stephania japonica TaxID=461633 RepID=A0AAP0I6B0_9MAGN
MADQQEQMCYERRHDGEESINKNVEGYGDDQVKERGIFDVLGGKKEEEPNSGYDHEVISTKFEKTYMGSDEGLERGEKPSSTEKLHRSLSTSSTSVSRHIFGKKSQVTERKVRDETRARRRRRRKQEYSKMLLMFIVMSITSKIRRP